MKMLTHHRSIKLSSLLVLAVIIPGCTTLSAQRNTIPRGTQITEVQLEFGLPDVISDESGDLARFYTPGDRPKYEWPAEAPRTFYYIDRNLEVVFVRGARVRTGDISAERMQTLTRMLERKKSH